MIPTSPQRSRIDVSSFLRRHLASAATCTLIMRSGSTHRLPLLDLVDHVHAADRPRRSRCTGRSGSTPRAYMMKNWLLAELWSLPRRAMPTMPRLNGTLENSACRFGIFRAAGAVAVLAVAGLRHEAVDHAVERHVVVELLARQRLEALGVLGREVGAQLDDDAAVLGVDQERVLRIERRRATAARRREPRRSARRGRRAGGSWRLLDCSRAGLAGEFRLQAGGDRRRHEGRHVAAHARRSAAPVWR